MDFGTIINKAQQNGQSCKNEVRYYSTKFKPPKKEERTKKLSVNIQKFLARKDAEEKKRIEEAKKRKDQLLELRSKDKKAVKRVNVMLKRTKSANRSVIHDAVDSTNTAFTMAGTSQPDEDDYGYVSQSASEFYNKMMEKYSKLPDEPKFLLSKKKVSTNLNTTKDRVKAALEREIEEGLHPHRKKRKSKDGKNFTEDVLELNEDVVDDKEVKDSKPRKPKLLKPAPVINFSDLLKIAEKKQHEPIVIEPKEKEEERLFTKKQKREQEKEREYKERREQMRHQKTATNNINPFTNIKDHKEIISKTVNPEIKKKSIKGLENKIPTKENISVSSKVLKEKSKTKNSIYKNNTPTNCLDKPINVERKQSMLQNMGKTEKTFKMQSSHNEEKNIGISIESKEQRESEKMDNKFKSGFSKQITSSHIKSKPPASSSKVKNLTPPFKQFSPPHVKTKSDKFKLKVNKGRIIDDDDEEYDSEMDDFIDDGPEEGEDYSKYISEIFGYDKKKYKYVDEDDGNMESSFAQQMREEIISTKIGILEDLEDIKLEEEMKKKKALLKKKKK